MAEEYYTEKLEQLAKECRQEKTNIAYSKGYTDGRKDMMRIVIQQLEQTGDIQNLEVFRRIDRTL